MEQVTEADKKWLAQLLDNDSGDIGINEDGEPYINFSDDYETIKRAKSICGSTTQICGWRKNYTETAALAAIISD